MLPNVIQPPLRHTVVAKHHLPPNIGLRNPWSALALLSQGSDSWWSRFQHHLSFWSMLRQVDPNWPDLEDVTVVPSRKGSLGYQLLPPFLHLNQGIIRQWHSLS